MLAQEQAVAVIAGLGGIEQRRLRRIGDARSVVTHPDDDAVGFIGYVVGFTLFGWYLHRVADDPTARRTQAVAAILGAFGQAAFEGLAFVLFATDAHTLDAVASVLGNTLTHGVVLGAIPLVRLYPWLAPSLDFVRKNPVGGD